jgi:predicted component of type VI protein secretion system
MEDSASAHVSHVRTSSDGIALEDAATTHVNAIRTTSDDVRIQEGATVVLGTARIAVHVGVHAELTVTYKPDAVIPDRVDATLAEDQWVIASTAFGGLIGGVMGHELGAVIGVVIGFAWGRRRLKEVHGR